LRPQNNTKGDAFIPLAYLSFVIDYAFYGLLISMASPGQCQIFSFCFLTLACNVQRFVVYLNNFMDQNFSLDSDGQEIVRRS